jgi:hypothetical protein
MIEQLHGPMVLLVPLKGKYARASSANLGAFDWIVIEEDEAIESEIEGSGQLLNVLPFGHPVDFRCDDLIASEPKILSFVENLPNVFGFILATEAQQHSALG